MIKVGVIGAGGRMGAITCETIIADPELELVAAIDPGTVGDAIAGSDVTIAGDLEALSAAGCEVAVDFTHLEIAKANAGFCSANGIHMVIGTSGFTDVEMSELEAQFSSSNCVVVPNFSISAVLLKHVSKISAPFFETCEVIELHHNQKKDTPSGTAMDLATAIGDASSDWTPDPTEVENVPESRGSNINGIPVHSVRMSGMVGHQEVIMGTLGQTLTLRQDSYDRSSFMPGVTLAVKGISNQTGVTLGLEKFLGI